VVIICTICFNNQLYFVLTSFLWLSLWTGIVSLNSINQLIFVMVKSCVFFEVRTQFLNIILMSFGFKGWSQGANNAMTRTCELPGTWRSCLCPFLFSSWTEVDVYGTKMLKCILQGVTMWTGICSLRRGYNDDLTFCLGSKKAKIFFTSSVTISF
jgi:hypothetical protein